MMNSRIRVDALSAAASGVQTLQFIFLIACVQLTTEGDIGAAIRGFMLMLYLEKIAVWALKKTANIVDTPKYNLNVYDQLLKRTIKKTNLDSNDYTQLAKTIENHPSVITRQIKLLEKAHRETCKELRPPFQTLKASIPPELKKIGHAIYNHFTCTENSLLISAIAAGHFAPHLHLTSLNYEDSQNLIQVLKTNLPYNLHLTFADNVSLDFQLKIRIILRNNDIKQAAWGCVTFQQGFRDQGSIVAMLPQEILNNIYARVYPDPHSDQTQNRKNFIKKVSSYNPGLFQPNVATSLLEDYKSEASSAEFIRSFARQSAST